MFFLNVFTIFYEKLILKTQNLKSLKTLYIKQRTAIRKRLAEFAVVPKSEYFYELIYCLLTPQSSAENAMQVVTLLRQHNLKEENINPLYSLRNKNAYIRFHKRKSKYITLAKKQFPAITEHMNKSNSAIELRSWLVKNIKGLGWKEASHFLRNIGHRNLAILERHILKNLVRYYVIKQIPETLTARQYLKIENKFQKFAARIGIPIDELDLLFWSGETGKILK